MISIYLSTPFVSLSLKSVYTNQHKILSTCFILTHMLIPSNIFKMSLNVGLFQPYMFNFKIPTNEPLEKNVYFISTYRNVTKNSLKLCFYHNCIFLWYDLSHYVFSICSCIFSLLRRHTLFAYIMVHLTKESRLMYLKIENIYSTTHNFSNICIWTFLIKEEWNEI